MTTKTLTMEDCAYNDLGIPTTIPINSILKKPKTLPKELKITYRSKSRDLDLEGEIIGAMATIGYKECAASVINNEVSLFFAKE